MQKQHHQLRQIDYLSLLQIDYRWFDQHHLDCFRYMLILSSSISMFLFFLFFFFFFEASSQSCRVLWLHSGHRAVNFFLLVFWYL